ncbi:hypothetical protein [Rubrimonas cliftonensis]|uniref:Uncharacterized protein n=1 Tax=Rubrimonas cliftonensis TaxID=89524 RepID=A0A1H4G3G6_9RHOB|nr:hypothetical protein [Rubrimonas cliftonensis]SEB04125.1 hypothetical protein SAMN05444370_1364 [Rubrimonas cliftonensis]
MNFIRFKDPNEALGLAVRLLAGADAGPFAALPFAASTRLLTLMIDRGDYGFAAREGRAVGVVVWAFVDEAVAARSIAGGGPIKPGDLGGGESGLVLAFRAVDAAATAFLTRRLRDQVFAAAPSVRFVRDYGPGSSRRQRAVVMRRRQAPPEAHAPAGGSAPERPPSLRPPVTR